MIHKPYEAINRVVPWYMILAVLILAMGHSMAWDAVAKEGSLVDLNRAGTPLLEIVSVSPLDQRFAAAASFSLFSRVADFRPAPRSSSPPPRESPRDRDRRRAPPLRPPR